MTRGACHFLPGPKQKLIIWFQCASRHPSFMASDDALQCKAAAVSGIPPELVHQILAHVDNDHRTLSSCSLVCRSWTIEATPFLFEELLVKLPTANLDDFVNFLRNSPHVCKSLRKLTIQSEVD